MSVGNDSLPDFLLARVAKEKAMALAATQGTTLYHRWAAEPNERLMKGCMCLSCWEPTGSWDVLPIDGPDCADHDCYHTMTIGQADAEHIAHWDPTRVLADCEAKRRIVALHAPARTARAVAEGRDYKSCPVCDPFPPVDDPNPGPCETLRLLALPYTDHPDYRGAMWHL